MHSKFPRSFFAFPFNLNRNQVSVFKLQCRIFNGIEQKWSVFCQVTNLFMFFWKVYFSSLISPSLIGTLGAAATRLTIYVFVLTTSFKIFFHIVRWN